MRNNHPENIQEHSLQVAMIAHNLAIINNEIYGGNLDANRVTTLAIYHDASEVITGDLATPIKYFNPEIKKAYKEIEQIANDKLYSMLPEKIRLAYQPIFFAQEEDGEVWQIIKAADKIAAYLKCLEELKDGNQEFSQAKESIAADIMAFGLPEVDYFMETFVPSFSLTLDELN